MYLLRLREIDIHCLSICALSLIAFLVNIHLNTTSCSFLTFSRNSICRNDICRNYREVIPSVMEGLVLSLRECQNQFKNRRWNCTEKGGAIEKIMSKGMLSSNFLASCCTIHVIEIITLSWMINILFSCIPLEN